MAKRLRFDFDKLKEEEGLEPWDRLPDEPKRGYRYFHMFLDLGFERKLTTLKEQNPDLPQLQSLRNLSMLWDWRYRANAYDMAILQNKHEVVSKTYNDFISKKIKSKMSTSAMIDTLVANIFKNESMSDKEKIRAIKAAVIADSNNTNILNNYVGTPDERIELSGSINTNSENITEIKFDNDEEKFISELAKQLVREEADRPFKEFDS